MVSHYLIMVVKKFYESYGARARQAEKNEGIDWKAVSHAIRSAYQLRALYTLGKIKFPLPEAEILKDIKLGKLDYKNIVAPLLEDLMYKVESLANNSDYPDKVNRKYWERFIMKEVELSLKETSWIIV